MKSGINAITLVGNFMYYFKKGFYMIRKNLHMKIKRIFCGILTAAMLLGQTGAVWAEATDTASESPTPTPDPHTEYYAQAADTDSIEGWPEVLRLRRSQQFSWT